jgi:hypothetical protein
MSRIEARCRNASAFRVRFSQSLASLRQRLSQASVRSTIQRLDKTTNPLARSERLTISTFRCGRTFGQRGAEFRPLIAAVGEQLLKKGKHPEQGRHDENGSISILNVGRMDNSVEQPA